MKLWVAPSVLWLTSAVASGQGDPSPSLEDLQKDLAANPGGGHHDRALDEYRLVAQAAGSPAQQTQLPAGILRHIEDVVAPKLLYKTDPEYTDEARAAGLEGTVLLTATIGEDGRARDIKVSRPLGFGLDEKALEAIQSWQFQAGTLQGNPVAASITVGVDFLLVAHPSRWHLIRAEFSAPAGASAPGFKQVSYPPGAGVGPSAVEEGWVIEAIGRQAAVRLSFDIDEHGMQVQFQAVSASEQVWINEAIAFVSEWRFRPAVKNGVPVISSGTVDLVWGQRDLTPQAIASADIQLQPRSNPGAPGYQPSLIVKRSVPSYTEEARRFRLQGTVLVYVMVGDDGVPKDLRVIRGLGMGLDENAIEAVRTWRFRPPLVNGQPASFRATVEVNFELP